jgi:hypothetical protein
MRALLKKNLLCVLTRCGVATVGESSKALPGQAIQRTQMAPSNTDLLDADGSAGSYARERTFSSAVEKRRFIAAIQLSGALS